MRLLFLSLIIINCGLNISAADSDKNLQDVIDEEELLMRKQLFDDLNEIKSGIQNLSLRNDECLKTNESQTKELPLFDLRFDVMPKKCHKETLPKDCAAATSCTKRSGIYKIQIEAINETFYVACDAKTDNGDWLIVERRQDGSEDFYRNWTDYEKGFGDVEGEFFIGLKKLYALTNYNGPQELLIVMEDSNGTMAFAKYDTFAIGNETELYKLKKLGKYSGTAGNSLQRHIGMKFTTKDRDNDKSKVKNCAIAYMGAWWYEACHDSNLNGKYNTSIKGIHWKTFRGYTISLSYIKLMLRRSRSV